MNLLSEVSRVQSKLQILHLEDSAKDAELIRTMLEGLSDALDYRRVETREEFETALKGCRWDVILSDYKLPSFDGIAALSLARQLCPETPFILVSGTIGEVLTAEALKMGAADFVLKDKLSPRLIHAGERGLRESRERKEKVGLEEEFRQAQKMEVVGRLAGGIAHDFNNLLTLINGYSQLLLNEIRSEDRFYSELDEISKAGERATALTRQLLAFSRKHSAQPEPVNMSTVIFNMEKMLRRLIGEGIELQLSLASDLKAVKIDTGYLEQVIMNLAVNARDAMSQGGTLTIRTAFLGGAHSEGRPKDLPPGDFAVLAVEDMGCGMTDEVKKMIFKPFFTTKGISQGTGLGLATVDRIVREAGGQIVVESKMDQGTTFTVFFPCVEEVATTIRQRDEKQAFAKGSETLLVVDDEAAVRKFLGNLLRSVGYEVLEFSAGPAAIQYLKERPESDDLLSLAVLDMVMPRMNGYEVMSRIKEIRPGVKFLFTSGYSDHDWMQRIAADKMPYIQKPYSPQALLSMIRDVLGKRGVV